MTNKTPSPGGDTGLPTLEDLHGDAMILLGLVMSMDAQVDSIGPRGTGLFACIELAGPLAKKLTDNLERIM